MQSNAHEVTMPKVDKNPELTKDLEKFYDAAREEGYDKEASGKLSWVVAKRKGWTKSDGEGDEWRLVKKEGNDKFTVDFSNALWQFEDGNLVLREKDMNEDFNMSFINETNNLMTESLEAEPIGLMEESTPVKEK